MRRSALLWIAVVLALGVAGFVGLQSEPRPNGVRPALTPAPSDRAPAGPEYAAAVAPSQRNLAEAPQGVPSSVELSEARPAEAVAFVLRVLDPESHPLVGARVEARVKNEHVEAATDAAGACRLPKPESGTRVQLTVEADGRYPFTAERFVQDELVITLFPLGALHGTVRDRETGVPIAGASVRVNPQSYDDRAHCAISDVTGRFDPLDAPVDTTFVLWVGAPGYLQLARPFTLRAANDQPSEILLERALSTRFRVVDAASGLPISGATVGARVTTYTTDDRGEVEVDQSLQRSESAHHVEVRAPGYCRVQFEVASSALEAGTVQLALPLGCRIEGSVLDAEGRPVADLSARAWLAGEKNESPQPIQVSERQGNGVQATIDLAGFGALEANIDARGRFAFDGLPAGVGAVRIEVERARKVIARRVVELIGPAGSVERADIRIQPPSGATVFGRLLLNGEPIVGRVHWLGAELDGWATTGPDGTWELTDVEPGFVALQGVVPAVATASGLERRVEVQRGARIECDLALDLQLATLGGHVTGPNGEPQPGVQIHLRSDLGHTKATTQADGSWSATMASTDGPIVVSAGVMTVEGERVAHAGDARVDFHLAATGTLRFRAVSATDGSDVGSLRLQRRIGLERFQLVATPGGNPPDSMGWSEVELPEGEHEVFAWCGSAKYRTAARRAQVTQDHATEVVFELVPALSVGFELAEGESPLPSGHAVILVSEQDAQRVHGSTRGRTIQWSWDGSKERPDSSQGAALAELPERRFVGLAPGRYALVVFPEDVILEPDRIDVTQPEQSVTLRWRAAD